jgi:hypothetical protein
MGLLQALPIIIQTLTLLGVLGTLWAVFQAKKSLRAQTVLKLTEGWRDTEIYSAISYINELRTEWKKKCSPVTDQATWDTLAGNWVQEHYRAQEDQLKKEWLARRQASQFLSKMGLLTMSGYMKPEDLFGVIPEMGRYLMVLTPIELAIQRLDSEEKPIADWDHRVGKWEFNYLWSEYLRWFKKNRNKIELNPIEYSS